MYQWEKINLFLFRFVLTGFGVVIANQMKDAHSNFSSSVIIECNVNYNAYVNYFNYI